MKLPGGGRFELIRRIGAGGMGVVYEAVDHDTDTRVALKTLTNLNAAALYRFKKEFRALADLAHPNLVRLYELVAQDDDWFFTMELVGGVELLDHVAPLPSAIVPVDQVLGDASTEPAGEKSALEAVTAVNAAVAPSPLMAAPAGSALGSAAPPSGRRTVDLPRLRAALPQLALGLDALHAVGKLHRDVKPSNVMVTRQGRVVLLDFGIVADVKDQEATDVNVVVGTPMYMSPEQAASVELSPATDWYAVGVVLYEVLTGRLPFVGPPMRVLMDKQRIEPPPPRDVATGVPDDLNDLCVALLRTRPEDRPTGAEVLRRLGAHSGSRREPAQETWQTLATPFVGREDSLQLLAESFESSLRGKSEVVFVRGDSGMGKSTFVRHFLDSVGHGGGALVFTGRCYERESVPYKAFDAIIDALSRYLRGLPRAEVEALMPRNRATLSLLFPVLGRVAVIAEAPRGKAGLDPLQLRQRAFSALRELFERIAQKTPTILFVDDLQWADADSAALLTELTSPPDPPPMLIILGHRREDEERSEVLRGILQPRAGAVREHLPRTLSLEALSDSDARRCAAQLLHTDESDPSVQVVARESGGNPFFLGELARYVQANVTRASSSRLSLAQVLRDRTGALSEEAMRLLEIVAVAGRPIRDEIAVQAAELPLEAGSIAMRSLRAGHFIRTASTGVGRAVESFHDKVREAVVGMLETDELRARHRALVEALRAGGETDAERMFVHARAAGMNQLAGSYARAAAERAVQLLAFDRAAELFSAAIDLAEADDPSVSQLHVGLAEALSSAGRLALAAEHYLDAAKGAEPGQDLDLRRLAAERLLQSGDVEHGLAVMSEVLVRFGMRLDATPLAALVHLVLLRIWLRVRGFGFRLRSANQITADELTHVDLCFSLVVGLGYADTIQATVFSARHVLAALRSGEIHRVIRALTAEAVYIALPGGPGLRRAQGLLRRAEALLPRSERVESRGYLRCFRGQVAFYVGDWKTAVAECDEGAEIFEVSRLWWEITTSRFVALWALGFLGELHEVTRRHALAVREADGRGDIYGRTVLRVGNLSAIWLARDDAPAAREALVEAMGLWPRGTFLVEHYWELESLSMICGYEGNGAEALAIWTARWSALERSLLLRVQLPRIWAHFHRGASTLLAAREGNAVEREALALDDAKKVLREKTPWGDPLGLLLEAGVHARRKDEVRAVETLERAVALFTTADMALYAAAAKRRLGAMIAGDRGRQLVDEGTAFMVKQRVKDVEKMTAMMTPGFAR